MATLYFDVLISSHLIQKTQQLNIEGKYKTNVRTSILLI